MNYLSDIPSELPFWFSKFEHHLVFPGMSSYHLGFFKIAFWFFLLFILCEALFSLLMFQVKLTKPKPNPPLGQNFQMAKPKFLPNPNPFSIFYVINM
jgi:hypothetical protein